jgi:hypothetical protein
LPPRKNFRISAPPWADLLLLPILISSSLETQFLTAPDGAMISLEHRR